jgi:membrane protein implicated in regulation of membrane protease activity
MQARTETPSTAEVAMETNALMTGLGILSFQLFPFALPLLVLVIVPLVPLAVVGLVLAVPVLVPLWIVRTFRRDRSRRREAAAGTAGLATRRLGPRRG